MGVKQFLGKSILTYGKTRLGPLTGIYKSVRSRVDPKYAQKLLLNKHNTTMFKYNHPIKYLFSKVTGGVKFGVKFLTGAAATSGAVYLAKKMFSGPNLKDLQRGGGIDTDPGSHSNQVTSGSSNPSGLNNKVTSSPMYAALQKNKMELDVKVREAKSNKMIYEKLASESNIPTQSTPDKLTKIYSTKADPNDKFDTIIKLLNQQSEIENDTRKLSLASLKLNHKELSAKANQSTQLYNSLMQLQIASNNANSDAMKKIEVAATESNKEVAQSLQIANSTNAKIGKTVSALGGLGGLGILLYDLMANNGAMTMGIYESMKSIVGGLLSGTGSNNEGTLDGSIEPNTKSVSNKFEEYLDEKGIGTADRKYAVISAGMAAKGIRSGVNALNNRSAVKTLTEATDNYKAAKVAFDGLTSSTDAVERTRIENEFYKAQANLQTAENNYEKVTKNKLPERITPVQDPNTPKPSTPDALKSPKPSAPTIKGTPDVPKIPKPKVDVPEKSILNNLGKYFKDPKSILKGIGYDNLSRLFKIVGKSLSRWIIVVWAKSLVKVSMKAIPVVGTLFGVWSLGKRICNGHPVSAILLESGSVIASAVADLTSVLSAGVATAVSTGISIAVDMTTLPTADFIRLCDLMEKKDIKRLIDEFDMGFTDLAYIIYGDDTDKSQCEWIEARKLFDSLYKDIPTLLHSIYHEDGDRYRSDALGFISSMANGVPLKKEWKSKWDSIEVYTNRRWDVLEIINLASYWKNSKIYKAIFYDNELTEQALAVIKSGKADSVMLFSLARYKKKHNDPVVRDSRVITSIYNYFKGKSDDPTLRKYKYDVVNSVTAGTRWSQDIGSITYQPQGSSMLTQHAFVQSGGQLYDTVDETYNKLLESEEGLGHLNVDGDLQSNGMNFWGKMGHGILGWFGGTKEHNIAERYLKENGLSINDFKTKEDLYKHSQEWNKKRLEDYHNKLNNLRYNGPILDTSFNPINAASYITANSYDKYSKEKCGFCARGVREALKAGGVNIDTTSPADGYHTNHILKQHGFEEIELSNSKNPLIGDVVVEEASPGHASGHIQMWNGKQWVSDFKQNSLNVHTDGVNGTRHYYRHNKLNNVTAIAALKNYSDPLNKVTPTKPQYQLGTNPTIASRPVNQLIASQGTSPSNNINDGKGGADPGSVSPSVNYRAGDTFNSDNSVTNITYNIVSDNYANALKT